MDNKQSEAANPKHDIDDSNLPAVMASLEMLTVNTNLPSSPGNKRKLRTRIHKTISSEILNRRCSQKPKKRSFSEMDSEEKVKEYYLDKSLKRKPNNLETIFEEKEETGENSIYMSAKRYKRMIQFQQYPTDSKLKKRRARVKKVFGSKIASRRMKGSMQTLLDKLNHIQSDSLTTNNTEIK